MCMITYIPGGHAIPWVGIYNGASWNQDGHGYAVATPEGIFVGKSFNVDESLDALYAIRREYPKAPALFHSRWATHGELSERNIHPFFVGKSKDTVVAHNGVLPTAFHPKGQNWRSDTNIFAMWLGRHENILSRRGRQVIAELIGNHNKLVVLTNSHIYDRPRGFIVNERAGNWDEGCWFSNYDHCQTWRARKATGGGSWLWDGIDATDKDKDAGGTGYPAITTTAELSVDEERLAQCPACKRRGGVELEANVCLSCDYCLDCMTPLKDCLCFWGQGRPLALESGKSNVTRLELTGSSEESGIES